MTPEFKVIAFFTGINDPAHVSFVHEANKWFAHISQKNNFRYDSTSNWENLNPEFLKNYQLVIFLDTRPPKAEQRKAFEEYMKNGGAWIGFHFAAFELANSAYPNDWDWYHEQFLGSGEYKGNTWRPTTAILHNADPKHPVMEGLPETFTASPNEWYSWQNDLRQNPYIKILASIAPLSFPLGTGPKLHEIWHQGYFPVVWTNTRYRMVYINMGHNDMDYEHGTNNELSFTFGNPGQDQLVINAIRWLLNKN
ncbi:MAG: ThuA domain-containing protein [Bacteroidales bacterium]